MVQGTCHQAATARPALVSARAVFCVRAEELARVAGALARAARLAGLRSPGPQVPVRLNGAVVAFAVPDVVAEWARTFGRDEPVRIEAYKDHVKLVARGGRSLAEVPVAEPIPGDPIPWEELASLGVERGSKKVMERHGLESVRQNRNLRSSVKTIAAMEQKEAQGEAREWAAREVQRYERALKALVLALGRAATATDRHSRHVALVPVAHLIPHELHQKIARAHPRAHYRLHQELLILAMLHALYRMSDREGRQILQAMDWPAYARRHAARYRWDVPRFHDMAFGLFHTKRLGVARMILGKSEDARGGEKALARAKLGRGEE